MVHRIEGTWGLMGGLVRSFWGQLERGGLEVKGA